MPKTPFIEPSSVQDAEIKIAELTANLKDIQAQLTTAAGVLEDRDIPWGDPEKKRIQKWRPGAVYAKSKMEGELVKIKVWLKHVRERNKLILAGVESSDDPTQDLLVKMHLMVRDFCADGAELSPEEQALMDAIKIHLGCT